MSSKETALAAERFNLIDEPWIPIAGQGTVSLRQVFSDPSLGALGGNARQKIAMLKLLLAIAQAAATPADDEEWHKMGMHGMGEKCVAYLEKWRSKFFLYGPEPFMQMPVQKAALFSCGALQPEIALGNNPRLFHMQCDQLLSDAEKALALITEVNMALGGKRGDRKVSLTQDFVKKTAPASPGMGFLGYLHTFLTGSSLLHTIWLNLLSENMIDNGGNMPNKTCPPPWEEMPETENCPIAIRLTESFNGRLTPMSRFCLLEENGVRFTEGITHPSYDVGIWDPSVSGKAEKGTYRMLWADPEKRPWRSITSLLAMIQNRHSEAWYCCYIKNGIERLINKGGGEFSIWSGGLKVSNQTGQQYLTGSDDHVESETRLQCFYFRDSDWYPRLEMTVNWIEKVAQILFSSVFRYIAEISETKSGEEKEDKSRRLHQKDQNKSEKIARARRACSIFWEQAEELWQPLIEACCKPANLEDIHKKFRMLASNIYGEFCPHITGKQIYAWAKCRPIIKMP